MIKQLSDLEFVGMVCSVFVIPRSSFYDFKQRVTSIKLEEVQLRTTINEVFSLSRGAVSRSMLVTMLKGANSRADVLKVHHIMRAMELVCKQPGLIHINQRQWSDQIFQTYFIVSLMLIT